MGTRISNHKPPLTAAGAIARWRVTLKWVFCGAQGLRLGWKAVSFVALLVGLLQATRPLLNKIAPTPPDGTLPLNIELTREFWYALLVLAATWVMALIEQRSVRSYGFAGPAALPRLLYGAGWGFASISALVAALWMHGSLLVESGAVLRALSTWECAAAAGVACLLVGLLEEAGHRGYLQFALARPLGFWGAALILSVAFGLLHAHRSGETIVGLVGIGAGALLFSLRLRFTRSLYWAVGFHAAWDWGQIFFLRLGRERVRASDDESPDWQCPVERRVSGS
jgi:uncharacterized protein